MGHYNHPIYDTGVASNLSKIFHSMRGAPNFKVEDNEGRVTNIRVSNEYIDSRASLSISIRRPHASGHIYGSVIMVSEKCLFTLDLGRVSDSLQSLLTPDEGVSLNDEVKSTIWSMILDRLNELYGTQDPMSNVMLELQPLPPGLADITSYVDGYIFE